MACTSHSMISSQKWQRAIRWIGVGKTKFELASILATGKPTQIQPDLPNLKWVGKQAQRILFRRHTYFEGEAEEFPSGAPGETFVVNVAQVP